MIAWLNDTLFLASCFVLAYWLTRLLWAIFQLEEVLVTKKEELTNPTSCFSKAHDDEVLFVLLGRDAATPDTIRFWVHKRLELGKNEASDPQIQTALLLARQIELAQRQSATKTS